MKIFKTSQVQEIDRLTIENEPILSIDLMERASMKFSDWYTRKFDSSKPVTIFAGPGNNGGDGLAVARILARRGFSVVVYLLKFGKGFSNDCEINLQRLREVENISLSIVEKENEIPKINSGSRIIDAIFGSGLNRPASGLPADVIKKINACKNEIISIDIPSGLFGEDNRNNNSDTIVRADFTITFEFPFLSFFFPENAVYTGKWKAVSIGLHPESINKTPADYELVDRKIASALHIPKSDFSHKGNNGHALIIAGSYGMMGASVLATKACIRSGAGLVTAHIPRFGYNIIQTSLPEALVSLDQSDILFSGVDSTEKFSAIGMGPGLNTKPNTSKGVLRIIKEAKQALLIDADALNIISQDRSVLGKLPQNTILTPHPGEFDRLAGKSESGYERHLKQKELSEKYKLIIILKGHNSIITLPDGKSYINSTGNPGLATGGSGDVLTGIITSLLAQGYTPKNATILGVYVHGLAADLALENQSFESLTPGDVIEYLGRAFKRLKSS